MSSKPIVLIVRDKQQWPSDDFMTLFAEEGYETRDIGVSSLWELVNNSGHNSGEWPDMGAIGTRHYEITNPSLLKYDGAFPDSDAHGSLEIFEESYLLRTSPFNGFEP